MALRCTSKKITSLVKRQLYPRKCISRLQSSTVDEKRHVVVPIRQVLEFVKRCMTSVDTVEHHANALAKVLTDADYRGHYSHGLNRLDMYIEDVQECITSKVGEPKILNEAAAVAHVDGCNLLGPVVGNFCMSLAIQKASEAGIGLVCAKGSNHYGIAGYYAMQALPKGFLGMSFTNTSPLVVPTRGKSPSLGTNPLALAAPGLNGDSFVLDMATSTAAVGKIEYHHVKNIRIPDGWGTDSEGKMTNNADEVLDGGGLMPLGGKEPTGGYKGYGLAMLVEILCGILGDAHFGPTIRRWKDVDRQADLGQAFIAINPSFFGEHFEGRMQNCINTFRGATPTAGYSKVLIAGDPEREHMELCDLQGGISYHPNLLQKMNALAKQLNVDKLEEYKATPKIK